MGKFNVGDKVIFKNCIGTRIPDYFSENDGILSELIIHGSIQWNGMAGEVVGLSNGYVVVRYNGNGQTMQLGFQEESLQLVEENSPSKNVIKMRKTVYNVIVVDKKTGKATKNVTISADNERQAVLKAFDVPVDNVFINTSEVGAYEEEKPLTAVIEERKK